MIWKRRPRRRPRVLCGRATYDQLPMPRVWAFGSQLRQFLMPIGDTRAGYSFEDDVRERVLEEVRPGVVAMWSDPRERVL